MGASTNIVGRRRGFPRGDKVSETLLSSPEPSDWIAGLQSCDLTVRHRLAIANQAITVAREALLAHVDPGVDLVDQTLRARIAELEHDQRLRDQIVATVSHEMRTPLAAIGGYVDLLQMGARGPLTELQLVDLQRIHRAYEHLLHVVNDLLSYHKLVAGLFTFDLTDVSIDDTLAVVADLVAPLAAERHITLEIERIVSSTVVLADQERVRQILVNLAGNAIKFTEPGGVVWLRATMDGSAALVEVEDTGIGIPNDSLETIFHPFTQLKAEGGAGLGLAISRDMARGMGGELSVTSTVGEGSCFALRLPTSTTIAARRTM
jgi:signal transduction histidine kinase